MKTIFAKAISLIFAPLFWVILFFISAYYKGLFQYNHKIIIIFSIVVLFPVLTFFILYAAKQISDFDITQRRERYGILAVINLNSFILLYFLYTQQLAQLFALTKIICVIIAVSSLITFFYKISFHITFSYTFAVLINALFSFNLWGLYLIVPVLFWSRLVLKKHTIAQMLLAICIDSVILYTMW